MTKMKAVTYVPQWRPLRIDRFEIEVEPDTRDALTTTWKEAHDALRAQAEKEIRTMRQWLS